MQTDLDFHNPIEVKFARGKRICTEIKAIDLFAGCGGISIGLIESGINVIAAVENDVNACKTLRLNKPEFFPNMKVIQEDITKLKGSTLMELTGIKKGELSILAGGPPCQGFSFANSQKRSIDDPRSKLMFEFIRMVRELQPRMFMMENVPGLMGFKDFFIEILKQFEDCGYEVRFEKTNAASHGVPQHRIRIIVMGFRNDLKEIPSFPPPTHCSNEMLKGSPSAATIQKYCFRKNGFTKEEVKDVWWNSKLQIMMNKKEATGLIENAMTSAIVESISELEEWKTVKEVL